MSGNASSTELDEALRNARLLGVAEPVRATRVHGGGNNRIFRIEARDGSFALKVYAADGRGRLEREFGGLQYASRVAPASVPKPIAANARGSVGLYEWIEGDPVGTPETGDVRTAVALLAALHAHRATAQAELPNASEAILTGRDAVAQLERRLERLWEVAGEEPRLRALLEQRLGPALEDVREPALRFGPLPRAAQTLSPSDFGLHNAVRRPDGRLCFLDFEYFGWDDPAKLVADIRWHPGMEALGERRNQFSALAADVYSDGDALRARLAAFEPLIALRWAAIVLGEFLPEFWERRVLAGGDSDQAAAKERQVAKASAILDRLQSLMKTRESKES